MKRLMSCLAMLAFLAMAPGAQAKGVLDFEVLASGVQGASISYAGGTNPLVGTGLSVLGVIGGNGTLNSGAMLAVTGGMLNFQTGNLTSSTGDTWNFGAGGSLTISGTVNAQTPSGGFAPFGGTSGTLLTATFSSLSVTHFSGESFQTLGFFLDDTNPALASYFGLASTNYSGFTGFTFTGVTAPVVAGGAFQTSDDFIGSGDTSASPVPAPGFLVLLCSGGTASLAGFALRRWKTTKGTARIA